MPRSHIGFLLLAIGLFGLDTAWRLPPRAAERESKVAGFRVALPTSLSLPFDFALGSQASESLSVITLSTPQGASTESSRRLELLRMPLARSGDSSKTTSRGAIFWILDRNANQPLSEAKVIGHVRELTPCTHARLVQDSRHKRYFFVSAAMDCGSMTVFIRPIELQAPLASNLGELMKKSPEHYPAWKWTTRSSRVSISIPMHCGKIESLDVDPDERSGDFLIRIAALSKPVAFSPGKVMSQFAYNVDKQLWSDVHIEKMETQTRLEPVVKTE